MAATNTNTECKRVIRALPLDPEPTISQMVKACTKLKSFEHTIALAVSRGTGEAMATHANMTIVCFNSSQMGHVQADYPFPFSSPNQIRCHHFQHPSGNGLHCDTKWQVISPRSSYHSGKAICGKHISEDHDFQCGFQFSRQTKQLDQQTQWVLHSNFSVQFDNDAIAHIPTDQFGPKEGPVNILIARDINHTPRDLSVIPEVILVDSKQEVTISVMCINPPFLLTKGISSAQMYILHGQDFSDWNKYDIYLAHSRGTGE